MQFINDRARWWCELTLVDYVRRRLWKNHAFTVSSRKQKKQFIKVANRRFRELWAEVQ